MPRATWLLCRGAPAMHTTGHLDWRGVGWDEGKGARQVAYVAGWAAGEGEAGRKEGSKAGSSMDGDDVVLDGEEAEALVQARPAQVVDDPEVSRGRRGLSVRVCVRGRGLGGISRLTRATASANCHLLGRKRNTRLGSLFSAPRVPLDQQVSLGLA